MINGKEISDAFTTSNYKAYAFTFGWTLPNGPGTIQDVGIVFDNDRVIDGSDRNLYVQSIELNGEVIPASGDNVKYMTGDQMRDYLGKMLWNGILYFDIPVPEQKLIVNAKGTEAGGVYGHFKVLVDGHEIGDAFTSSNYEAYAFTLPNDPALIEEVGIVFDNDKVIDGHDRNLYVQSIELNGEVFPAPGDEVTYMTGGQMREYLGKMLWNGTLYFGIHVPRLILWNTMDSKVDVENSKVGPGILQTTYFFPLWGEAQITPAKFGNGLFINHDTNEGWQNDGGNFFALDNKAMGMLPNKGTIEFWMRFMYDCTIHNWAPLFAMNNELTGHYANWPPARSTYFDLIWSGWDYGTFGKRYQFNFGNGVDEIGFVGLSPDYSTYPGGDLAFYTNELSHFAVVWDIDGIEGTNETLRLYVNGQVAISTQDSWTSSGGISNYTYLGTHPNGGDIWDHWYNAFKGVMDNLKIWNYSKTNFDDRFFEGLITCPDNLVVESDEDLSPEHLGYPEVIVNCEGEINFDYDDIDILGSSPNEYTVQRSWTITDACGSQGTCTQIINVKETGLSTRLASNTKIQIDKEQKIDLSLYPNPFEQGINLEFNVFTNSSDITLRILDQQGRILNAIHMDNLEIGRNCIQLSRDEILGRNASAGLYLLRLELEDHCIHKRILLK
jgi:hypothetical protein